MADAAPAETEASPADAVESAGRQPRPRIAYLSYSSGEFDARARRMARSAMAVGYEVTLYARWEPGLPSRELDHGLRIIRVPWEWRLAVPGLGWWARRRAIAGGYVDWGRRPGTDPRVGPGAAPAPAPTTGRAAPAAGHVAAGAADRGMPGLRGLRRRLPAIALRPVRAIRRFNEIVIKFPLRPLGWAAALQEVAEPADIWHGMWAGSLPALIRLRMQHGGRSVYDGRDVFMESRNLVRAPGFLRTVLLGRERQWAQQADAVLTVNDAYAEILSRSLQIVRPTVVMNCPARWTPPDPPPDLLREATGLPAATRVVLYQGQLISARGIEQAMEAILLVPDAVLVLLGYGTWFDRLTVQAARPPYLHRVFVLAAVPPDDLLAWTASADVLVMPIQPTTLNHRFTTPQKLFEGMAAGVPIVASDLPGMAELVRSVGAGELCDPTSPPSIAAAIQRILDLEPSERASLRARILEAAHERYNWETQVGALLDVYAALLPDRTVPAGGSTMRRPARVPSR
jgi:glycosyltransferase involved in cell wall biosynthesis